MKKLLVTASILTLVSLALMVWSIVSPRPVPVFFAMSIAQGLGVLAFLCYLVAVVRDLRRKQVFSADES